MINFFKNPKNFIWILLGLAIITRLFFIQNSLWHNDAADFVNSAVHWAATGNYLSAHAPDYPGWVATITLTEKLFNLLLGDYSLVFLPNLLSNLFGIASILLLFVITKKLTNNPIIAFLAGIFLTFMPGFWAVNELALSDTPAVFWLLLSLYYLFNYLEKPKNSHLRIYSFALAMSVLTRINSLIFLPVLVIISVILILKRDNGFKLNRNNLYLAIITLLTPSVSLIIYYLTNSSSWDFLLETSRRVTPSAYHLSQTFAELWLISMPPILILWAMSIWYFIKNKFWLLLCLTFLPVVFFYYYYAGWWQNGSFDVNRYLTVTSPFIAIAAGIAGYKIFNSGKKYGKIILGSVLSVYAVLIFLGLTSISFCAKTLNTSFNKTVLSPIYCSTKFYARAIEDRLDVFNYIQKSTPVDATVMINDYEWSYSRLFGNKYGTENRKFINLKKDPAETVKIIGNSLNEHQTVYLPVMYLTKNFMEKINEQHWLINYLKQNNQPIIVKISK